MVVLVLAVAGGAMPVGCGSTPPRSGSDQIEEQEAPEDFSISLIETGATPAWVILQPDGSIRAGVGVPRADSPVPPLVRNVDRATVNRVWRLAEQAGLWNEPTEAQGLEGGESGAIYRVSWAANGRRGERVMAASSAAALGAELRALAWIDQP